MIYTIWSMMFLGICSITDIKERKVCGEYCLVNIVFALFLHIFIGNIAWIYIIMGMVLGGLFFVISTISKEAIGRGDAFLILTLGCIEGIKVCFENLIWAFILCSVISLVGIFRKKKNLSSAVPFAPYLFWGRVVTLFL